ncbi:L-threonylcarbamoyladenylate synthase [Vibrio cholerae]|uniref:L-threonylcarbamoyladenylate synthase n=2 Tax=Vibrio cholerae TaxID=666 RepID=UPI0018F08127|nr:L-threonylcarbamoyladenylate synthase [Vibrio cholerae]EGR4434905.1 threonylcarbamoyl-AMP synthase [Vibrio cholerae]EGR4437163.1 threonylcarbamoyl-AMP synthase [Vibrio cholerae]EJL6576349.1 threonylcarbamoyl-AMP synthase [Vibrio cholerae]EJL6828029.1 threonylcarbamoyl-AMP synthase [Vibrio cholerae]EJL7007021.1 threonylcarbamoyl-AMP synthase [Vibrio cholerae]
MPNHGDFLLNTQQLSAMTPADIECAAQLLKQGQLVAIPTETVYGLAADATQPEAVKQIFSAKGRPANHPLIVHLGSAEQLSEWATAIAPEAYQLAEAFWPGPLTLLLPKAKQVSPVVTGGLESVGIRVPAHPVLLDILKTHRLAVAAPSANPYKKLSPTSAQQVLDGLNGRLAAVLDGGECQHGLESTIVDLTSKPFRVLRAGPITASELSAVLGQEVLQPQVHQVAVPGNVDSHYQPKTRLRVIDDLARELATQSDELRIALLHLSALQASEQRLLKPMPQEAKAYGQALYRSLAEVDKWGVDEIWLERPPQGEAWLAVHDRLRRAAS